jgi:hypothetical protein
LHCRLNMTKKVARTVNPNQSEMARASYADEIGAFASNYLVFLGKLDCSLFHVLIPLLTKLPRRRVWSIPWDALTRPSMGSARPSHSKVAEAIAS